MCDGAWLKGRAGTMGIVVDGSWICLDGKDARIFEKNVLSFGCGAVCVICEQSHLIYAVFGKCFVAGSFCTRVPSDR